MIERLPAGADCGMLSELADTVEEPDPEAAAEEVDADCVGVPPDADAPVGCELEFELAFELLFVG